jgi:NAD(P)-dependent dehydrogenase (short-subunit alcohol dehydrogenase family)
VAPTPEAFAEVEKHLTKSIPLGRFGEADEVAKTVLFRASGDASNIQAAEVVLDGGTTGVPFGAPIHQGDA